MIVAVSLVATAILLKILVGEDPHLKLVPGLLAAVMALITTVAIEKMHSAVSVTEAIANVGLRAANRKQIPLVLIGTVPLVIGYLIIFFGLKVPPTLVDNAGFVLFKLVIAQGVVEEVVFRGLIFRHFRFRHSFWKSCVLSGVLFSLIHLVNLVNGISTEMLISVATSIVFGFILTFPLALIFETGAGSIIGGGILHLAIDSLNCYKEIGETGIPMTVYLVCLAVSSALIVWYGRKSINGFAS